MRDEPLLLPVPAQMRITEGVLKLPARLTAQSRQVGPLLKTAAREVGAKWVSSSRAGQVAFLPAGEAPAALREWARKPEGYALVADANGVRIFAANPAGHLYGAITLKQLMRQYGLELPCLEIGDAPVLPHRGAALSFPQGHTEYRRAYMRHLVPKLALWKINALYLYLETYFDFPSLPHFAGPGAMTAADARELDALCKAYNIRLIPMLNTLGHCGEILGTQRYHGLIEHASDAHPGSATNYDLCACNPETHALVDTLLGDIMDCFSSDIIHVGGDEVVNMGTCDRCAPVLAERGKPGLYLDHFGRIRDVAAARGRKIGIWGDMLLHHFSECSDSERRQAFAGLADGVIIYDWHYWGGSPETLRLFVDAGMQTIACSSTHLCYSNSLWMGQAGNQRDLFADAIAAGASGGMTTAWLNYHGLHEEQFNYLHATGGTALWSGPDGDALAPGLTPTRLESAYCLHRYGLRSDTLTRFWHTLGDAKGPVLQALKPLHGVNARKCLFHTDNVLTFWMQYGAILRGENLELYRSGISEARQLWDQLAVEASDCRDPYLALQSGPLLMHEHLLRRFEITDQVYSLFDRAAQVQYDEPKRFASLLDQAASVLLSHLDDFSPVEWYLTESNRGLGLEKNSLRRVRHTKAGIRKLARFLCHLASSARPLPAFAWLHEVFLGRPKGHYYLDREHEWASGPGEFRRHGILPGTWNAVAADAEKE